MDFSPPNDTPPPPPPPDPLATIFDLLDLESNGDLDFPEFKVGLTSIGVNLTQDEAVGLFDSIDAENKEYVNREMFLEWISKSSTSTQLDAIRNKLIEYIQEIEDIKNHTSNVIIADTTQILTSEEDDHSQSDSLNSEWIPVANIPQHVTIAPVAMLNHAEILCVPIIFIGENEKIDGKAIYKYNIHQNEWTVLIDYPQHLKIANHAITCDEESNKLYIAGTFNEIMIVDIKNKTFNNIMNKVHYANHTILVNVDGTIHKIEDGDWMSDNEPIWPKHLVWNTDNNSMDEIHDFYEEENIGNISGASAVYVRSKGIILMVGGRDLLNDQWLGVWIYYLSTNKWQQVKGLTFNYHKHSMTLSFNEEYVVIAGGWDEKHKVVNAMHVLDIRNENNYVLRRCSIKCPMSGIHKIVRTGGGVKDQLLITGYIQQSFKSLPLLDIVDLIQTFYDQETIHWCQYNTVDDRKEHNHFVITLKQIVSSLL